MYIGKIKGFVVHDLGYSTQNCARAADYFPIIDQSYLHRDIAVVERIKTNRSNFIEYFLQMFNYNE